ncbi:MAG: hypothetical protein JNN21_10665 [Candidatus Accumulibacter sp.]|nr:hypothetical protein [Accumulibacter sp.]
MSHPAYQIIEEFLQAEDSSAQARRNAIVALATIADDEALQRLLQLAISDANTTVRAAAEAELATLCKQSPANLGPVIAATLAGSEQAPAAYALLGRLNALGATLPPLSAALPWLRLALSQFRQARGATGWWQWAMRAMVPGLFAALLGVFAALAYMQSLAKISMRSEHDLVGALGASLMFFVGPLIAFGTRRTTPYRLHPHRGSGALAEIAWACLYMAIPGVVCVAIILSADGLAHPDSWVTAGLLVLLPPIVTGAIRAGTIAADGALGNARRLIAGCFAGFVGAAAGLVCVTLATGLFHGVSASVCSQFWSCWLPICCGLAAAYAWIDAGVPCAAGAAADGQRLTICAAVVGVFLVGGALPFVRASGDGFTVGKPIAKLEVAQLNKDEPTTIAIPLDSLPARIELNLSSSDRWNLKVDIDPPPPDKEPCAYLWSTSAVPPLQPVESGSMHEMAGKGSSTLIIFERDIDHVLRDSHALGAFLDAWWGRQHVPPAGPAAAEPPPEPRVVKLSAYPVEVAPTIRFGIKQ